LKFSYPTRPDVNVCQGYSLTIEPGQVVALVGPSGSGKSTIMNLLLRFYDPIEGQILLDGVDIKDLNIRWLRSQIGYVGQEPILFTGSVEDNVARGKCDFTQNARAIDDLSDYRTFDKCCGGKKSLKIEQSASIKTKKNAEYESVVNTPEDIEEGVALKSLAKAAVSSEDGVSADVIDACKLSNAHEFVSNFPTGYNTDVGENSTMVSGGQKQRIAIARALVKRPCVLLLDEATSALDASSEKMVQESIDRLQNRNSSGGSSSDSSTGSLQTIVIIAHRLTTIRNADKIAVIDGGRVVEQGTHDELLAMNGLYHQLWNKQSGQH
jgi:ATP-binding cassette subfamily B (MDR/TAP) protein 1